MGIKSILNNLAACQGCGGNLRNQLSYPPLASTATASVNPRQIDPVLLQYYEPLQKLGAGAVAHTWLMRSKQDNGLYAVKLVPRPLPDFITESLLREITIQSELAYGHLGIVDAYEVLLTPSYVAIVLEYCADGTLLQYLDERVAYAQTVGLFMSEAEARFFFWQFVDALRYCHSRHVCHRDLKLENTLLDGSVPPRIKLSDFGSSRTFEPSQNLHTKVGTFAYMSPQILAGTSVGYDGQAADVWSAGILLVLLLVGQFPFEEGEDPWTRDLSRPSPSHASWMERLEARCAADPRLAAALAKVSDECKDLLRRIFEPVDAKRITLEGIQQHPWYTKSLPQRFSDAWGEMQSQQAKLTATLVRSSLDVASEASRSAQIAKLVELATQTVGSEEGDACMRIDLRQSALMKA